MAISAHHHEIDGGVGGMGQDGVRHVHAVGDELPDFDLEAVAGEMVADLDAGNLVLRNGIASPIARAAP
jgi:hypothetical protein